MKTQIILLFLMSVIIISCEQLDMTESGSLVPETVDEDTSLPSLEVNSYSLHVETYGDSTNSVIINIHGGPGDDYRSMLNASDLANEGYFVVFYDQIGTGLSQRVSKYIFDKEGAIDLFFDNLQYIINYYKTNDSQKIYLLGHSWGAMIAAGYIDKYPNSVNGVIMAEPGGFNWPQTSKYLENTMDLHFFSEELNDAIFSEQIFAGHSEDEILDYKAAYFKFKGVTGNPSSVPFFRCGVTMSNAAIDYAYKYGFDFTQNLSNHTEKILFLYSENNHAYSKEWAEAVSEPLPNVELKMISGTGHEMIYFAWDDTKSAIIEYLNEMQ